MPLAAKAQARNDIRGWLTKHSRPEEAPRSPRQQSWVRINGDSTAPDLDTVTVPGLAGVFLAKCTVDSLHETATFLDALESSRGLEAGSVSIIGLIESAAALQQIDKITRVRRLTTLAIGEVDLMADLRMTRSSRSEPALDSLRTRLVVSCAAAELLPRWLRRQQPSGNWTTLSKAASKCTRSGSAPALPSTRHRFRSSTTFSPPMTRP
ncbi:citrate lyase beta [Arthrobacter sp. Hiyo4]|nr:citrate lyase beta [Arthrobacter sp. Hiyo4]